LDSVAPLTDLVKEYCPNASEEDAYFFKEIVLWTLAINSKLDRTESEEAFKFDSNILSKHLYGDN
jgi:magnesium chelatase subunit I